jgi:transposase
LSVKAFCIAVGPFGSHQPEAVIMTISPEVEARILRYHHVEKWRIGTIASQLGVHPDTVARVLAQAGIPRQPSLSRPSRIDPYLPFIFETLKTYPTLTAARLHAMVYERGYRGHIDHFRHLIARHRPRRHAEAYLRLRTLPGEQAQIDWAHFGHLQIGRARRTLMAFVMVLSFSRQIFLRFFMDARMEAFLRGHVEGIEAFGGCARVLLYDNLKSAVLERRGEAIRFHPTLLDLANHYGFEPRPVAVARGNEKGRVERAIRYVRGSFFAARTFKDLEDLNAQAQAWCWGMAADRPCPGEDTSVREAFAAEQALLLKLPDNPYPVTERVQVAVHKTPYVRFDLNDYSVPFTHVRRSLTVLATTQEVRIVDGAQLLASHPRTYDKGQQVEDPSHVAALVDYKRQAARHRAADRLAAAVPATQVLLTRAAEQGRPIGPTVGVLLRLLNRFGAEELQAAVLQALDQDAPHPSAVRLALDLRREQQRRLPPVALILPAHVQAKDAPVRTAQLDAYDRLKDAADD